MKKHVESKYANLPLCFLAYGSSLRERYEHAILYGIVEVALNTDFIDSIETDPGHILFNFGEDAKAPQDFDGDDEEHIRVVFASRRLGVRLAKVRGMQQTFKCHRALKKFVEAYEKRHGTDARTKIHFSLLFQMRDGTAGISDDEFRVFAAVNSCLGDKPCKLVRQSAIRIRALGYKSKKAFEAEYAARTDGATPLPNHTLSRITDRLNKRFFHKMKLSRATYYGQKHLTDDQFSKLIYGHATKSTDDDIRSRKTAEAVAEAIRKSKDDAKKKRIIRRSQGDLFNGSSPPLKFHLVDELRARETQEDFDELMRNPLAKHFTVNGTSILAFSPLPVSRLRAMYVDAHRTPTPATAPTPTGGEIDRPDDLVF